MTNYTMAGSNDAERGRSSYHYSSGSKSNTICSCFFFWLGNAFAIASMVIGIQYKDDCRLEPMIPIYLIGK